MTKPKSSKPVVGEVYYVDSYDVSQYEGSRFVDDVTVLEFAGDKLMLCHSPKYRANVLVLRKDLAVSL